MRLTWRAYPLRAPDRPGAVLTVDGLADAGIAAGFTTRLGGRSAGALASLNLTALAGDDPAAVAANRARVLERVGAPHAAWINTHQVHGTAVVELASGADPATLAERDADALVTSQPGQAIAVLVADCVPILLADPQRRRIGVVHGGWRGLVAGIVGEAAEAFGVTDDTLAVIGPSIGPCCYEVGEDVVAPAVAAFGEEVVAPAAGLLGEEVVTSAAGDDVAIDGSRENRHLDLWRVSLLALRRAGIGRIGLAALCTRCEPHRFFSHRAGATGRQAVVAALVP